LLAKSGSRGKIQERYRHGLIASRASQRRTVEAETEATRPSGWACLASSAELQRATGTSRCAGGSQAIALTSATTVAAKLRGRPERARSVKPASPCAQNRLRQRDTTSTCTSSRPAIAALVRPRAANSTILARITCA